MDFLKDLTIRKYWLLKLWWDQKYSYLHSTGWIRSFREKKPVDKSGNPIPWLSLSMVAFLKERLKKDMRIFEYGAGNSTLFFAKKVQRVTSVEYDTAWVNILKPSLPENCKLLVEDWDNGDAYARKALETADRYHLILIDGRDRVNCCHHAVDALTEDGVIIFDDTNRQRYLPAVQVLEKQGFKRLNFWGIGPGSIFKKCTSIFYRSHNCFDI